MKKKYLFLIFISILVYGFSDNLVRKGTPGIPGLKDISLNPSFRDLQFVNINDDLTPEDLVSSIVGEGVEFSNVVYTGNHLAAGVFSDGISTGLEIDNGIMLSSGWIGAAIGPNNSPNTSNNFDLPGDTDLSNLIGGVTYDAAILEFDFIPQTNSLTFQYIMGSEEYPEYLQYADVFAFFLNGENIGLIPGTDTPVSISNVNHLNNSEYYLSNEFNDYDLQCDGSTTLFTAYANVVPGETTHIKLAVADATDHVYDTWVFIAGDSFVSDGEIQGNIYDSNTLLPIEGANVLATGNIYAFTTSDENGFYQILNVPYGYGYHITAYAAGYYSQEIVDVDVTINNPTVQADFFLDERIGDIGISELYPDPNPDLSQIMLGGNVHRYYYISDTLDTQPVAGVEIIVSSEDEDYTFFSDEKGIVDISIPSSDIDDGNPGAFEEFTISSVNNSNPSTEYSFYCQVIQPSYSKYWNNSAYGKMGLSFLSVEFSRGASTCLIENNSNQNGAELINITRQARGSAGVDFNTNVGPEVQCGNIIPGYGASAGVGGSISGITEDYYQFPHQDYNNWEAVSQFILIGDGSFGALDNTLIRFLTILEEHLSNTQSLEDAFLGDKKGVDLCANAYAEAHIGLMNPDLIGFGANANIGIEGHSLFNIINHAQSDFYEYNFGVSGTLTSSASAGIILNLNSSTENFEHWGQGLGNMINIFDFSGTRGLQFSVIKNSQNNLFEEFVLKSLQRNTVNNYEEIVTYNISGDDVYTVISNLTDQIECICDPESEQDISVSNDTFAQLISDVFEILYALQTDDEGDAIVRYKKERSNITDIEDFNINIGISLTSALRAKIGGGAGFEQGKSKLIEEGKWQWGNHLKTQEYNAYIPEIEEEYEDVLQEIADNVPLWIRALIGLVNVFTPGRDEIFYVGDTGSFIVFTDNALPQSVDEVNCTSWSWYGEAPSRMLSDLLTENREIYVKNRSRAEREFSMQYGIGGFYQFEPYDTELNDDCEFTIFYSEEEVTDFNEADLEMYIEDKENHTWINLGGSVDTDNNSVTANVSKLGLFTLAPKLPEGEFGMNAIPDSIAADGISTTVISSEEILYNNSNIISDGELFTVNTQAGVIISQDEDLDIEGIQISSQSGIIQFELQSGNIATTAHISAFSCSGNAESHTSVTFYDTTSPVAPANLNAASLNECIHVTWDENEEPDIAGYKIYFDNDQSGPPYEGIATVYGLPSPVIVGANSSYTLNGLYNDTTYYIAVTAYDVSGNESDYSEEITATPNSSIVYGDIDNNAYIESYDVSLILMNLVEMDPLPEDPIPWEEWRFLRADVDLDGELHAIDGAYILQYVVGLLDSLPVYNTTRGNENCIRLWNDEHYLYIDADNEIYGLTCNVMELENIQISDFEVLCENCMQQKNDRRIAIISAEGVKNTILKIPYRILSSDKSSISLKIECNALSSEVLYNLNESTPQHTRLESIYPNPFNPSTNISFVLAEDSQVSLDVYNIKGQKVQNLYNGPKNAGSYQVVWCPKEIPSGLYFVRLTTGLTVTNKKVILIK